MGRRGDPVPEKPKRLPAAAGSKLLTSKGKFYELKGTLAGYDEIIRQYRKCTSCHSKEPGSQKLTAKGEELKAKGTTMHDLGAPAKPQS